jgi:hypothetical protein
MARKQTPVAVIATKMRKLVTRTVTRNTSRIALGIVVAVATLTGGLAAGGSTATAQRAPRHHGQPTNVAANEK